MPTKKYLLIFGGLLGAVIVLELLMILLHPLCVSRSIENRGPDTPSRQGIRILCAGDSFTYGVGARKSASYPQHLQRMLEEHHDLSPIEIYNTGIPGTTSSHLRRKFRHDILRLNPHGVIIMTGLNDRWNLRGITTDDLPLSLAISAQASRFKSFQLLHALLINIKETCKLFPESFETLMRAMIRPAADANTADEHFPLTAHDALIAQANTLRQKGHYDHAREQYTHFIQAHPDHALGYLELARCWILQSDRHAAATVLGNALDAGITHRALYAELDSLAQHDVLRQTIAEIYARQARTLPKGSIAHQRAAFWLATCGYARAQWWLEPGLDRESCRNAEAYFRRALAFDPNCGKALRGLYHTAYAYRDRGDIDDAYRCYQTTKRVTTRALLILLTRRVTREQAIEIIYNYLAIAALKLSLSETEEYTQKILAENIRAMAAECAQHSIPLILVSYPEVMIPEIARVAREASLVLIDLRPVFAAHKKQVPDAVLFLSARDRHCTPEGYRIIAETIAATLRRNNILNRHP